MENNELDDEERKEIDLKQCSLRSSIFNDARNEIEKELIELGYNKLDIIKCINDINIRLKWNINSLCLVYSRKNKTWYNGKILNIFGNTKTNEKWLVVLYNNKNGKKIQRFNQNIKPIQFKNHHFYDYNKNILKFISLKLKQIHYHQQYEKQKSIKCQTSKTNENINNYNTLKGRNSLHIDLKIFELRSTICNDDKKTEQICSNDLEMDINVLMQQIQNAQQVKLKQIGKVKEQVLDKFVDIKREINNILNMRQENIINKLNMTLKNDNNMYDMLENMVSIIHRKRIYKDYKEIKELFLFYRDDYYLNGLLHYNYEYDFELNEKNTLNNLKKIGNIYKKLYNSCIFLGPYDKYELFISGYIRRIENFFISLQIPSDIEKMIYFYFISTIIRLIFCDERNGKIDKAKYIERGFLEDFNDYTLKHLSNTIRVELIREDMEECSNNENQECLLPEIHLWTKYGVIKRIYPIINENVQITEDDVMHQDIDPERWVEIPSDVLKRIKLKELNDLTFIVEKRNNDGTWPRAKDDEFEWEKNIKCGDILDVKDSKKKWYESLVTYVYPKKHECKGCIVIHYIGWMNKWDERLSIQRDNERIAKRGSNSNGPHYGEKNGDDIKSKINIVFNGIRKEIICDAGDINTLYRRIKREFKDNGLENEQFSVETCSGFKIKTDIHVQTIVPYYMGHFNITKI